MKKRLKILCGAGFILIAGVFVYWDYQANHKFTSVFVFHTEPTYDGQTLHYWLEHWYGQYGQQNWEAAAAVRSMGTNALPYRNGSVLDIGILSTGSKGSAPALGCCSTRPRVEYLSPSVRGEAPRTTREARVLPISAPRHHQAETAVADSASARLGRLQFRAQSNSRQRQNSSGYHP